MLLRHIQGCLERRVFGTRLQEYIWQTRHLYKRNWASGYLDTVNHTHRTQIVEACKLFEANSLLEVGCASGANLLRIRQDFPFMNLIGVDINYNAISIAKQYFKDLGDERVDFIVGKASSLVEFEDCSVDLVLVDALLMFIAPDCIENVISELCRVSSKGIILNEYHLYGATEGRFIGGRWVYDLLSLLRDKLPYARIQQSRSIFAGGDWDIYGTFIVVSL